MYLVGAGDGSLPALRTAGAALGKKVRGKAIELVSLLAESRAEIRAHGVSILLGAYSWNLKTGKPTELATIAIATKDSASVTKKRVSSHVRSTQHAT